MAVGSIIWKNGIPDEAMFERLFGEGYEADLEIDFADVEEGEPFRMDLADASDKPWNGSASRFTDEQYRRSCLVDTGQGEGKSRYKLPVREPSGAINKRALSAAYSALAGARGGVSLSPEKRRSALRKLRGLFRRVGKDVPEGLAKLADLPDEADLDEAIYEFALESRTKGMGSYDPSQWMRACIVNDGYDSEDKSKHQMPVMAPDGTPDERAMRGAVTKLVNSPLPQAKKRDAAKKLVRMFRQIDENPPDTLLGLAGHTRQPEMYYTDHAEDAAFLITPLNDEAEVDLAEAESDGKVRFWKQLLPYRKFTYSKGSQRRSVSITRKLADRIVSNFGKAPEMVSLLMASGNRHHDDGPSNTAGEIEKIEARGDGIYGLCAVLDDKAKILKAFPKMGISVGLNTNYVRRSDGKKFGPIIFHGAVTSRPYLHGMKPWQLVLENVMDPEEVISLAESEYEPVVSEEDDQGGRVKVTVVDGKVVVLDDDGNEVEGATLSDEDLQTLRAQAEESGSDELEGRVTTLTEDLAQERRERREERNQYRMDTEYRTVAPAFRRVMLPLINLADDGESVEVTLSEKDGQTRKLTTSKAMWELVDYMKKNHAIEMGERGSEEEAPPEKAEDVQIAELADAYAAEHEMDYAQALIEVQQGARPSASSDAA